MSLYCTWIRVCGAVLWSPTKHQHCSRCLGSYYGPCLAIKSALSKLGQAQKVNFKQYMKEEWQGFIGFFRFHGIGSRLSAHSNVWHTSLPHIDWPQEALLKWVDVIDPLFLEKTETTKCHQDFAVRVKPKWLLPRVLPNTRRKNCKLAC